MNESLLQLFIELISTTTGLHVREQDKENLAKKIWGRVKYLKLSKPEEYYQILIGKGQQGKLASQTLCDREWKELIRLLTTGESYFFRDKGQFTLLRNQILPELIESKKKQINCLTGEKPSLRLWSAGCSTGEEPYSLAILISEILSDWEDWHILILGTDINHQAIEKAKEGIYSSWSFRMVDTELQLQYFHQRQTEWEIDRKISRMVKFNDGNLVQDDYPNLHTDFHHLDLIICRNVFVYFEPKAISLVLKKFYHTLAPGGYLIAGHTELYGQDLGYFQVKVLPESIVYQHPPNQQIESYNYFRYNVKQPLENCQEESSDSNRYIAPKVNRMKPIERARSVSPLPTQTTSNLELQKSPFPATSTNKFTNSPDSVNDRLPESAPLNKSLQLESNFPNTPDKDILKQAENFFQKKAYREAIKHAERAISLHPQNFNAYYLLAKSYANLGDYNKAIYYCQQTVELDYLSILPYYLLAQIAEEKGDLEKAKSFFKRIIYLAPYSISAYLELGLIYKREGNIARAKKMLATVVELLNNLPPPAKVEQQGEVTVAELLSYTQKILKDCI